LERDAPKDYRAAFERLSDEFEDIEKVIEQVHDESKDSSIKWLAETIFVLLCVIDDYFVNLDLLLNGDDD
jgi:hypothetical protein